MARLGAVVRRGEDYGVVVALDDHDFSVIEVEWDDGSRQWVAVSDVEWVMSGE